MALMYNRKETKDKIVIVYKYQALWYYILIVVLIVGVINQFVGLILLPFFIIYAMFHIFGKLKPGKEIKKAMMNSKVKMSGNRFSLTKPLTFEISKN